MLRLAESRDRLTIVADQIGGPTPAADIAATLLRMAQVMQDGQRGGLYHYGGQPHVSWAEFARAIFAATGKPVTVEDIPTSGYPTPAQRPANSRLDGAKLWPISASPPPDWQRALRQCCTSWARISISHKRPAGSRAAHLGPASLMRNAQMTGISPDRTLARHDQAGQQLTFRGNTRRKRQYRASGFVLVAAAAHADSSYESWTLRNFAFDAASANMERQQRAVCGFCTVHGAFRKRSLDLH